MNTVTTYPRNKQELLEFCLQKYRPELVDINVKAIAESNVPAAEVKPMQVGLVGNRAFDSNPVLAIAFILALNATNHMFWDKDGENQLTRYSYEGEVGARGWHLAVAKAFGKDSPSLATFRMNMQSVKSLQKVCGDLPRLDWRFNIYEEMLQGDRLEAVSQEILSRAQTFGKLTVADAAYLADVFPRAFADSFLKKAQLALAFIAGHLAEANIQKVDLEVTAMADYQVPRTLRAMNMLVYSKEVADLVDQGKLIEAGSPVEIAIRAATVMACEALARTTKKSAAEVDNFLWLSRTKVGSAPFHLTVTTAY